MISGFEYARNAIRGTREYQEDASAFANGAAEGFLDSDKLKHSTSGNVLAVLADGMGGHVGGAYASRTACNSFISSYASSGGSTRDRLAAALQASNRSIAERISEDRTYQGMGCTLVGAYFRDNSFRWISVGDSLLYLFRNDQLKQLNEDHSFAPVLAKMVENGDLTREQANSHPQRHALLSALMGDALKRFDLPDRQYNLHAGDWVIIASDGILTLSHEKIAQIIKQNQGLDPKAVVDGLLKAVDDAGRPRQDNTTVMAIRPQGSGNAGQGKSSSRSRSRPFTIWALLSFIVSATAAMFIYQFYRGEEPQMTQQIYESPQLPSNSEGQAVSAKIMSPENPE